MIMLWQILASPKLVFGGVSYENLTRWKLLIAKPLLPMIQNIISQFQNI